MDTRRRCSFKEYASVKNTDGTSRVDVTISSGTFIGWGINSERYMPFQFSYQYCLFTIGIIEMDDGSVKLVPAEDIQFLKE